MGTYIGQIKVNNGDIAPIGSTLYGTCDTAAATAAKVAVVTGFDKLIEGATVHIKFTNSNIANGPTLAIKPSSSGTATTAKSIKKYGTTAPGTSANTSWQAGSVLSLTYDGEYWQMNGYDNNTVIQKRSMLDGNYEILFSGSTDDSAATTIEAVNKATGLIYNPHKYALTIGTRGTDSTIGFISVAEGGAVTASGEYSHAEGGAVTASGEYSHAEGKNTTASGSASHVEGFYTVANHRSQHVFGEYNISDASTAQAVDRGNYVEIVGNGTSATRSNARTLDWNGNEQLAGNLILTGASGDVNRSNGWNNSVWVSLNSYLGGIGGTFWTKGWTATSTNAVNVKLTDSVDIPPGNYLLIGSSPGNVSGEMAIAVSTSNNLNIFPLYTNIKSRTNFVFHIQAGATVPNVYLKTVASAATTYSNIDQGGFRLIKLG